MRWALWKLACGEPQICHVWKRILEKFPGIAVRRALSVLDRWWVPVSSIVLRPTHRIPPVSCTSLVTQSGWPMHASFVTTHVPHCLALTLSCSTHYHAVSLYRVLTLSHVHFRTNCHMLSPSVSIWHCLALFRIHLIVGHATGQFSAPALSHAQFDATFNAQVTPTVVAPTVAAHTHCCANHIYTTVAPYSTPLITLTIVTLILHHIAHHSAHQPLLYQLLLKQTPVNRPRGLLH